MKKTSSKFIKYLNRFLFILLFFVLLYAVLSYKIYYLTNTAFDFAVSTYTLLISTFLLSRFLIAYFYDDNHRLFLKKKIFPKISFVIACKNEVGSIYKTIRCCLSSKYPNQVECIAVNDGSTDQTLMEMKRAQSEFGTNKVKIINFAKNRGKREAMAHGVNKSSGEIIIFVDSDSFVKPQSAKIITEHFLIDPKIGAVSGNSMVENLNLNILTKMQAARYGVSFDIFKASESVFGTVTCCPGCFSAYRKKAIIEVIDKWRYQKFLGSNSTYGDDRSLTNFILRKWRVIYCRKATATTIVPSCFSVLAKQQFRWKKSWIREGTNTASFIWTKNPIASISFYINLIMPIIGPLILLKIIFFNTLIKGSSPLFFFVGTTLMSLNFGIYYYLVHPNRYWIYITLFTYIHTFVLIWQMPFAIIKIKDTSWGTR